MEAPRQVSFWDAGAAPSILLAVYLATLALVSFHLYRTPIYDMDSVQYMGNALLMEETNPVLLHQRVYSELRRSLPKDSLEPLLGNEPGAPPDQNRSRQERATNPYRFAEFLPLFAIRPLYNQTLYLLSKTGIGLVHASILISVGSYFFLGVLLFFWLQAYTTSLLSLAVSLLSMMSPPLTALGRDMTSDALASLLALSALYLIFQARRLAPGLVVLLASIYFRTDFIVLAGPVIFICWLQRRIQFWHAAVLALVAITSVLCINHFAGDYGLKMLYYRNFVGTPSAPGEVAVTFSARDYLAAFRSGITKIMQSFFLPFLLVGVIGLQSRRILPLFGATLAYVVLHFLILPNWQERWVAVFYLSTVICAVSSLEVTKSAVGESLEPSH